jgi:hypothetical protein
LDTGFDQMQVGQLWEMIAQLLDDVWESRNRVLFSHILEIAPWTQSNGGTVLTNRLGNGFGDFQEESGTVLDGATVLVGTSIGGVLNELIY